MKGFNRVTLHVICCIKLKSHEHAQIYKRKTINDLFLFQVLLSQTREKQAATLSEVTWRGRTVPVKSEPVRLFLLNLQESSKEVEMSEGIDNKISIYESILKQCIDAQQVLRDSLQEDQVSKNQGGRQALGHNQKSVFIIS